jgi:prepilin-type N-terminal cleavage/methylation domain-containing protein
MNLPSQRRSSGFTFVELLVAVAVGGTLIAAAVLGYATVSQSAPRGGRVDVRVAGATLETLYGPGNYGDYVSLAPNPNYLQGVEARRLKDRLLADVSSASAVFCLGRNQRVALTGRTNALLVPAFTDFRTNATPEAFRNFLTNTTALNAATVFAGAQNGVLTQSNCSVFVLGGLQSGLESTNTRLNVLATYEVDFIGTTDPSGTFASVRRYAGTNSVPTDYYHVFYAGEQNVGTNGFRPLGVYFARTNTTGATFPVSPNHPFTFVWWPDPLVTSLSNSSGVSVAGSVRSNYAAMAGRTSLFFALPVFPGL